MNATWGRGAKIVGGELMLSDALSERRALVNAAMRTMWDKSVFLTSRKFLQMTNEPKMAPSAPENDSAHQIAQPGQSPQEKVQEKAAPLSVPANGGPEPKKNI